MDSSADRTQSNGRINESQDMPIENSQTEKQKGEKKKRIDWRISKSCGTNSKRETYVMVEYSIQFGSVPQSCLTLCDLMDHSMPGLPVHHQLPEFTQTHLHWVSDAIQPSHPLSSPSPPAFKLFHHQGLFKWVSSSHQVAKVLEFHLQHQSFQWTLRTDLLYDGLAGSPCSPRDSQESSPTPQFKSINS